MSIKVVTIHQKSTNYFDILIGGETALENTFEAKPNDTKMDPFPFQRFP